MKPYRTTRILSKTLSLSVALLFSVSFIVNGQEELSRPAYYPKPASQYRTPSMGFIHGVQYWVNPGVSDESIMEDFRKMAQEDKINGARLAFWTMPVGIDPEPKLKKFDVCFKAAAQYGVKLNPVLPQLPGWLDGQADKPENRLAYKEHIQKLVSRYKDEPALGMWTVDIEPSRSWKAEPCPETLVLYRSWLPSRYESEAQFLQRNWGAESALSSTQNSFANAFPINNPSMGGWNNFQGLNDYITFTAYALAEQVRFVADYVKELDPAHPTSCTPPDVLHNQPIENGRNMWWLADAVDCPSAQAHAHWHFETADMPRDTRIAISATVRKIYCSTRGRDASYTGEVLGGLDLGESTRLQSPTAKDLLGMALCHLAEGSKGYFIWIWNPLKEGPNAGAWNFRQLDGSPSDKSRLLSHFGEMAAKHNALLYEMRPADTRVAIFDSMDASIYLYRRSSSYHAMSMWYVMNQYGFYKAMRKEQLGCDFIDELGLLNGQASQYDVIYVPFSMCMTEDVAKALREYAAQGGTILVDSMTAFTTPWHMPFDEQPGLGLQEVLGVKALSPEIAYGGWTDITSKQAEQYFDRFTSHNQLDESKPIFDETGAATPLAAVKFLQPVEPLSARTTHRDSEGRPLITVNDYQKGHAIWTGTLLGLSCRDADTPPERYRAVADIVRPFIKANPWKLGAPANTIICRRLTSKDGELYILLNEGQTPAEFVLDFGRTATAEELLWPDSPAWKQTASTSIQGTLDPEAGSVIYCK